jgi:sigma-B regulation protein RsbU (phosphoserine phosphatase)
VLGILPIVPYSEEPIRLAKGDMLVLHSDGVTEANDVNQNRAAPAAEIMQAVTKSLAECAAGAPRADDITLAVARLV